MIAVIVGVGLLWYAAGLINTYFENKANAAWNSVIQLAPNSPEQIKGMEEVANDFGRRSAGKMALLSLGKHYLKTDPIKARDYFMTLVDISHEKIFLEVASLHAVASTYEKEKNWNEAAKYYLKAAALPGNIIAEQSRMEAALSLEAAGNNEEALKLYNEIASKKDTQEANQAKERILWLEISS